MNRGFQQSTGDWYLRSLNTSSAAQSVKKLFLGLLMGGGRWAAHSDSGPEADNLRVNYFNFYIFVPCVQRTTCWRRGAVSLRRSRSRPSRRRRSAATGSGSGAERGARDTGAAAMNQSDAGRGSHVPKFFSLLRVATMRTKEERAQQLII